MGSEKWVLFHMRQYPITRTRSLPMYCFFQQNHFTEMKSIQNVGKGWVLFHVDCFLSVSGIFRKSGIAAILFGWKQKKFGILEFRGYPM